MSFVTSDKIEDMMMEKPPIGVTPADIVALNRINELAKAISRYAEAGYDVPSIEMWANEIVIQCGIIKANDNKWREF